jgi:hypothetical protein
VTLKSGEAKLSPYPFAMPAWACGQNRLNNSKGMTIMKESGLEGLVCCLE